MSWYEKVVTLLSSKITQAAGYVRIRLILQLIKDILRFLKKLLKYFNGTALSIFIVAALLVLFKNLDLNLNDSEPVVGSLVSSLKNWYKLPDY